MVEHGKVKPPCWDRNGGMVLGVSRAQSKGLRFDTGNWLFTANMYIAIIVL